MHAESLREHLRENSGPIGVLRDCHALVPTNPFVGFQAGTSGKRSKKQVPNLQRIRAGRGLGDGGCLSKTRARASAAGSPSVNSVLGSEVSGDTTPSPKGRPALPDPEVFRSQALGRFWSGSLHHFGDLQIPSKSGLTPGVATLMPLEAQALARRDGDCTVLGGARGSLQPPHVRSRLQLSDRTWHPEPRTECRHPLPGARGRPPRHVGASFGWVLLS